MKTDQPMRTHSDGSSIFHVAVFAALPLRRLRICCVWAFSASLFCAVPYSGGLFSVDVAEDVATVLARVEAACARIHSYRITVSTRECWIDQSSVIRRSGPLPSLSGSELHTAFFQDTYSRDCGRQLVWTDRNGDLRRVEIRLIDAQEKAAGIETLFRLQRGEDYLKFLRPQFVSHDALTALHEHPASQMADTSDAPGWLAVEIPFRALEEFDDLGVRVYADTNRGMMPVRVDAFVRIGNREVLVERSDVKVIEAQPDIWVPARVLHAEVVCPDPITGQGTIRLSDYEVDMHLPEWNVDIGDEDLQAPLLSQSGLQVDHGRDDKWMVGTPIAFDTGRQNHIRSFRLGLILFNVLLVLTALLVLFVRHRQAGVRHARENGHTGNASDALCTSNARLLRVVLPSRWFSRSDGRLSAKTLCGTSPFFVEAARVRDLRDPDHSSDCGQRRVVRKGP